MSEQADSDAPTGPLVPADAEGPTVPASPPPSWLSSPPLPNPKPARSSRVQYPAQVARRGGTGQVVIVILALAALAVGGFAFYDAEHLRHQLNQRIAQERVALTQFGQGLNREQLNLAVCSDWPAYSSAVAALQPLENNAGVCQTQVESAVQAVGQIGHDLNGVSGIPGVAGWQRDLHQAWVDLRAADSTWDQLGGSSSALGSVTTDVRSLSSDVKTVGISCS